MEYFGISDIGLVRSKNQDSYICLKNKYDDVLLLVADGIGGGNAGEVASFEAVNYFNNVFKESGPFKDIKDVSNYVEYHLKKCNSFVYYKSLSDESLKGMGTTLTGVIITNCGVCTLNCGDSRVYGFIDNKSFRLTDDHTLVNQMLKKGQISYEESLNHPKKHYLVKAIGILSNIKCDVHRVKDMDYYLICSDGLHSYVSDEEITKIVLSDQTIEEKVNSLKDLALLKGGFDNITIILARR